MRPPTNREKAMTGIETLLGRVVRGAAAFGVLSLLALMGLTVVAGLASAKIEEGSVGGGSN